MIAFYKIYTTPHTVNTYLTFYAVMKNLSNRYYKIKFDFFFVFINKYFIFQRRRLLTRKYLTTNYTSLMNSHHPINLFKYMRVLKVLNAHKLTIYNYIYFSFQFNYYNLYILNKIDLVQKLNLLSNVSNRSVLAVKNIHEYTSTIQLLFLYLFKNNNHVCTNNILIKNIYKLRLLYTYYNVYNMFY